MNKTIRIKQLGRNCHSPGGEENVWIRAVVVDMARSRQI